MNVDNNKVKRYGVLVLASGVTAMLTQMITGVGVLGLAPEESGLLVSILTSVASLVKVRVESILAVTDISKE